MSRLESNAEPTVSAMALGRGCWLDPFLQPIVAAWAYKTVLVFETGQATAAKRLPASEYNNFASAMLPPPEARIYIASYEWEPTGHLGRFLSRVDGNHPTSAGESTDTIVYKATLTVGAALLNVALAWGPDGSRRVIDMAFPPESEDRIRQLWPLSFSFDWPSTESAFGEDEFTQMAVVNRNIAT